MNLAYLHIFVRRGRRSNTDIRFQVQEAQNIPFKAQPTNAFFAAVNQMFGGSFQLPTTAERCSYRETFYSCQPGQAYTHRIKISGCFNNPLFK